MTYTLDDVSEAISAEMREAGLDPAAPQTPVAIRTCGVNVWVKPFGVIERLRWWQWMESHGAGHPDNALALFALAVCDPDGRALLDLDRVDELREVRAEAIAAVVSIVTRLNRW